MKITGRRGGTFLRPLARARACRKQASEMADHMPGEEAVDKLRLALEDITAVCILEGFQKQEHLLLVDTVLKELGK